MKDLLIVGVDVSKLTLDFHCKPGDFALQTENKLAGFKLWLTGIRKLFGLELPIFVVMEHTGRYSARFEMFLRSKSIDFCKVPALQIKRSIGVARGKNDKVDAARIAEYAWLRRDLLVADVPVLQGIAELRNLLSLRSKLVKDRSGYLCRLKEMRATESCSKSDITIQIQERIIQELTRAIKKTEDQIRLIIRTNEVLKKTCTLLTSIKGVGLIVAAYMIANTNNFTRFANARKFNCYAGLAPFAHESGTSIKSRSRVSHLANKEVKTLLNLAAFAAIQFDPELKTYYQKRVAEGMKKMACLNIIRSKIVSRMYAVVKRETPYITITLAA
jgi:transposase